MRKQVLVAVALAKSKAEQGVEYSSRLGAVCPVCGWSKMPVYCTRKWKDRIRERYHKCANPACLVCTLGLTVKSTELDTEAVSA